MIIKSASAAVLRRVTKNVTFLAALNNIIYHQEFDDS